jgi:hypothetical protein
MASRERPDRSMRFAPCGEQGLGAWRGPQQRRHGLARHRLRVGCSAPQQGGNATQRQAHRDSGHGVLLCVEQGNAHPRRGQGPRSGKLRASRSGDLLAQHQGQQQVKARIRRHRPSLDAGQRELRRHAVGIGTGPTTHPGHQVMANRHRAGIYEAGDDCDASELDFRATEVADEGLVDAMSTVAASVWGDRSACTIGR